jgi:hypothetical protein
LRKAETLSFADAQAECAQNDAQLVVPLTGDEATIVGSLLAGSERVFIGMQDFASVGGGSNARFLAHSFEVPPGLGALFDTGQPTVPPLGGQENCVDEGANARWDDLDCADETHTGAMCEVPSCGNGVRDGFLEECDGEAACDASCHATQCPHPDHSTVILSGNKCFVRLNDTFAAGLNFVDGRSACSALGLKLPLPATQAENKALRALARIQVWVDDSDLVLDGHFKSSDGTAPGASFFFPASEPADVVGSADCTVARTTGTGQWHTVPCTQLHGVVCQQ